MTDSGTPNPGSPRPGPLGGSDQPFAGHCERRSIVLPRCRVLFLPVPKAGSTSMRWILARAAGLTLSDFGESLAAEGVMSATIHDMSRWPAELRWHALDEVQRQEVLSEEAGWLRFALVREPVRRLFSAWQSKFLIRDPQYTERYGRAAWFPRVPESPDDVVQDFRNFVLSLGEPSEEFPVDVHWAPQTSIIESGPSLNHVGRIEALSATLDLLAPRLGIGESIDVPRENETLVPFHPGLIDAEMAEIVASFYARDFLELGYEATVRDDEGLTEWRRGVEVMLPAIGMIASRHERIAFLSGRAREFRRRAQRLQKGERAEESSSQGRGWLPFRRSSAR